jgi:hypothetical protein
MTTPTYVKVVAILMALFNEIELSLQLFVGGNLDSRQAAVLWQGPAAH